MRAARRVTVFAIVGFLGAQVPGTGRAAVGDRADDPGAPLPNWPAPPYWQREVPRGTPPLEPSAAPATPPPAPFVAVTPCRVLDTRGFNPPAPAYGAPALAHLAVREFQVVPSCGIPKDAVAVSANATVVAPAGPGYLALWDGGATPWPGNSTLNFGAGAVLANAAIVPLGATGTINARAYVAGGNGTVDFVLDVNGYYSSAGIVNSVSGLSGDLTLAGSGTVTVTPAGNTITIGSSGGGGTITGVTAGTGLTGGGAVGGVTLGIANGGVGATQIANGQVVKGVNGAKDEVTIQGAGAVSVSTAGNTITVGAPAGSMTLGRQGDTTLIGAGYTELARNVAQAWTATSTIGAPAARSYATAVWTGSKMIVWGGSSTSFSLNVINTGGKYDPATDSWEATSTVGAPTARYSHSAVWTGSKMVVWGGWAGALTNTGGQYDPATDLWTATTTAGAPSARQSHTAVWAVTRMIVWGGTDSVNDLSTGALYFPATNSWVATGTVGAPAARRGHTAVWTGTKMIVWGGIATGGGYLNTGGLYDPATLAWSATSPYVPVPLGRTSHSALWTGTKMIVWGGYTGTGNDNTGGIYDPATDGWIATATAGAPPYGATAVWTGSTMVVCGSFTPESPGGLFDPASNSWSPLAQSPSTSLLRVEAVSVWTGSRMIVWGGRNNQGNTVATGGQWMPVSLYLKN